ncbi:O-antigen polymerase [Vibrio breoganii]
MENSLTITTIFIVYISAILIEQKRSGRGMTLLSLLLFYGIFYSLAPIFNTEIQYVDYSRVLLLTAAIMLCSLSYWISCWSSSNQDFSVLIEDSKVLRLSIFSLLTTSIVIGCYIVIFKIGVANFFFVSRAERALMQSDISRFMFFRDLINACCVFSICMSLNNKWPRFWKNMFIFTLVLSVSYSILTISRSNLVQIIFPILYILSVKNKFSKSVVNITLIIGFLVATLWKSVLATLVIYQDYDFSRVTLEFPPEFSSWYFISENVFNPFLFYGKTIADAILSLMYPFYDATPLSIWYVQNFEPDLAEKGGGRGFSLLVESYINFGYIGIFIIFSLLGLLLGLIEKRSKSSFIFVYVCAVTFPILHKIYRSELLSIMKVYWWYYLLPIVMIMIVLRFKTRIN